MLTRSSESCMRITTESNKYWPNELRECMLPRAADFIGISRYRLIDDTDFVGLNANSRPSKSVREVKIALKNASGPYHEA